MLDFQYSVIIIFPNKVLDVTVDCAVLFAGEVNRNIADMENALDPVSEEEHLKEIWRELGVGKSGYLTIQELATVCEHIGMDEMNQEVVKFHCTAQYFLVNFDVYV